ncbi:MAG: hypothetical protein JWN96_920 [Mycobacterium sp.]|nr:hypothetical protein [Mycobacterium sp.]
MIGMSRAISFRNHAARLVLALTLLVAAAGCSASTTGPAPSNPSPSPATASEGSAVQSWSGTDLLWDAIGGNDGFTAVGNSGVVVTSADGTAWRQQAAVTHQSLRGVASGAGTVVAVGTGGTIASWPQANPSAAVVHPSGVDVPLLGVAYGAGTWIVGGSGGTVLTSKDLKQWTAQSSGTDGDIFAIAYGAGHFVAATDAGGIIASTDGSHWVTVRAADGLWLWGATFGAHGFLVSGAGGTILQSTEGLTWVKRATGTTQVLRGVAYGSGGYLAVGSDATVVSSPDGITWTPRPIGDEGVELWRPAAGPSEWLAVGAGGTRLVFTNLVSWTGGQTTRTAFYGLGANPSLLLASGVNGSVARRQPDGTWVTVAAAPGRRELRGVSYLAQTWVVTGGGGTILTSSDGVQFTPRASTSSAELWSVAALTAEKDSRLVVVGAGGALLVSDDRGQSWQAAVDPQKETLFSVAAGPAGLVAVGVDGAIVRSSDGLHWSVVQTGLGQTLRAVAGDGSHYVAVGATGTVLTSTDGQRWSPSAPVTRVTLRGIVKVGDAWIAVGGGGVVIRSTDLRSWKLVPSPTDSEMFAVKGLPGTSCGAIAVAGVEASIISDDCGVTWTTAP